MSDFCGNENCRRLLVVPGVCAACSPAVAEERLAAAEGALIRCAVISGEDGEAVDAARSGAMKQPSLAEWAVGCVSQLRADYDECLDVAG